MKSIIIQPVKMPPILKEYDILSVEAQKTRVAIEAKYSQLLKSHYDTALLDPADYYKSIYKATFQNSGIQSRKHPVNNTQGNDQQPSSLVSKNTLTIKSNHSYYTTNANSSSENVFINSSQNHYSYPICKKLQSLKPRMKAITEVVLDYRPSDEEIAESVWKLTQKTSDPDSPLLDIDLCNDLQSDGVNILSLANSNSDDISYSPISSQELKFSSSENALKSTENVIKPQSEILCLLKNGENKNILSQKYEDMSINKKCLVLNESFDGDQSPTLFESLPETVPTVLLPVTATQNKGECIATDEESLQEKVDFNLLSDFEFSQNDMNSPMSRETLVDCFEMTKSPKAISSISHPASRIPESPKSCIENKEILDSESPYPEEKLRINEGKKHAQAQIRETSTSVESSKDKKNSPIMDLKRINPGKISYPTSSKRKKSAFKPPNKVNILTSEEKIQDSELDVINFSKQSQQQQKETLQDIETSPLLSLTLIYSNGLALVNTFYSAADFSKRKYLATQPRIKSVVVLTRNEAQTKCYLLPLDIESEGLNQIRKTLITIISSKKLLKVICNFKDFLIGIHTVLSVDYQHGIKCENCEDPVIASWLVDSENQPSSFKMMCQTAGLLFQNNNEEDWKACLEFTPKLMQSLKEKLESSKQWPLFTIVEMKLIPLLACMEMRSIKVDMEIFVNFSEILKSKLGKLETAIYKEAGHKFCLNSHTQLRQILFEELRLDEKLPSKNKIGKTSANQLKSTCESSLNILADVHPLPSLVLEYRQLQKLKSTYVDGIKTCVVNGSLKTHWDQTAAATGRLTSSQPNIQAVPKIVVPINDYKINYVIGSDVTFNAEIFAREPFISNDDHMFLAADFQQIELRLLAHLSADTVLLAMFWQKTDKDIFISLASQWFKKSVESVTLAEREQIKRVVYAVIYGIGKEKLSDYLKVKPSVAKDIMNSFLLQFPAIDAFIKKCWEYAKEFGYTETVCGRRRYFPNIHSQSPNLRAQAQRQAVNFCVQGSAADICKLAMLAAEEKLQKYKHINCRLLLQIHDELVWEVPETQLIETKDLIQQLMEDTKGLCSEFCMIQVPLTVTFSSGKSWAHLVPLSAG